MGLSKIDGKLLFVNAQYPYGIDPSSDAYPHELATTNSVETWITKIRFDWNLGPNDEPNKMCLIAIKNYGILWGADFYRAAAGELLVVTEDDLLGRVMDKYSYMRAEFRKVKKKSIKEEEAANDESLEESSNHGIMKLREKMVSSSKIYHG